MPRSLKSLSGYAILAEDGEIGQVDEFYFEDRNWAVRYLVVDTGEWLGGRKVLVSPLAVDRPQDEERRLPVALTREMVQRSPDISSDRPVSRQQEINLHDYYGWSYYWGAGLGPGLPAFPLVDLADQMQADQEASPEEAEDPSLHSSKEVIGYSILARDGEIGRVADFIVSDEDWRILYLVVDTGGWLSNRSVLVSPSWVEEVNWAEARVQVDLKRETIERSPEYDPAAGLDREYETRLFEHYGRDAYWQPPDRE